MEPTPLQRALHGAPERAPPARGRPEQELFFFRLGELRLGVPSENVREVIRAGPLTPLPRAPPFILGVCGHRGEVLPVLDLLRFLGKGEARISPRTRLFVGVSGTFVTGVVTDSVIGLQRVPVQDVLPAPVGGEVSSEHFLGVLTRGPEVTSLLHFSKVLQTARQRAVGR
ncbi:MAG TPA: chemotaxis protein CheW [Myxococcales bacterium]|nr:chemotaxis protein CheW [Myxococcales bacterium]